MGFDDMLAYEGNCVKKVLALPELEITITVYDTYSDCEVCGMYGTTVLMVDGDLGDMESGDHASCCGGNQDGNYYDVAQWINKQLEEHGRSVPTLLTPDAKDKAENDYYEQAALCKYDFNDQSLEHYAHKWGVLSDAFEAYYTLENLVRLYSAFGVTIHEDYKADEIYDYNDEEEECQED